jgi:plastocyanin
MTSQPRAIRRRPLRVLLASIAALVLPLALTAGAACDTPHPRTWTVQAGQESHDQAIQGMAYLPRNIYINAHDTIRWVARSAEPHTVTFLAKGQPLLPFDPSDPKQLLRVGGKWYDGKSYYNSGLLSNVNDTGFPTARHYSLKFGKVGTFVYWCLLHGKAMKGTVHVRPAGTHYPFTQWQYDRHSKKEVRKILHDGYHLWHETRELATRHTVIEGNDDGIAMVMRFVRHTVYVHVGQKVTFKNVGMDAPHTVTFGEEEANIFAPYGDPTHFAGGKLNSGIQLPGSSFTVTFTKAGTYKYICGLHDFMGMVGKVVVKS